MKLERIHAAFETGDVAVLRDALGCPADFPNNPMPLGIGPCLLYAIYWSPLRFIQQLLKLGADPNPGPHDGFPPLIAALSKTREGPGSMKRTDVLDIVRLLLRHRADPNQRGINGYTALHMAVAERNREAIDILLAAGADPSLKTRIDEYETPAEMPRSAGLEEFVHRLSGRG